MNNKRFLPLLLAAAGVLLLAAVAFIVVSKGQTGDPATGSGSGGFDSNDPMVGTSPDFELPTLEGGTVKLSDLKGHPVLINYWTTWCPPCREEMPLIQDRLGKNPELVVLAVDSDEDAQTVKEYISQFDYDFMFVLDPDWSVEEMLGVRAYPTSIFVDASGVVRARYIGGMSADALDENLARIGVGQ